MAKTEMSGKYEIGEQEVCRQLIHSAVRLSLADSEPLAVHLAAMSAHDVLRAVAEERAVELTFDFDQFLKPDRRKEFWTIYKENVNFFKHADKDSEEIINIAGLSRRNELQTLMNISNYSVVFGPAITSHMKAYLIFIAAEYPDVLNDVPSLPAGMDGMFRAVSTWPREDRMSSLSAAIQLMPDFMKEREDDHQVTRQLERVRDRD
jgi:hypothetical protein